MPNTSDSTAIYSSRAFESVVTDSTMFGSSSQRIAQSIDVPKATPIPNAALTDNSVYQVSLIVLFVLFFANTYRYSELLGLLFKAITRKSFLERLYSERSNLFKRYMRNTTIIGGLLASLLVMRALQSKIEIPQERLVHSGLLTLGSIAVVVLIHAYRFVLTRTLSLVSGQASFFKRHNYLSNIYFGVATNLIAPLFIFGANYHNLTGEVILKIIYFFLFLTSILYLYRSYLFFIKQKVSNLQWFLYLCAVDIFPVSLIVALWRI